MVMNAISIIKPINLYPRIMGSFKGAMMKIMMWFSIPIWILTAVLVAIFADGFITGILAFVALLMGIAAAYVLFSGGKYKPEKSFFFWRLSKEKMSKLYKYFTIGGVIIIVLLSLYEFKVQNIFYLVAVLIALYAAQKSFAVHEDVDFVANMEVSDLLGMEVDEKIQASYLNFDTSNKPSDGSNIMLLTDKKLLFAFYDGSKWSLMNKFLKDIAKIGRINTEGVVNLTSSSSCLYVEFIDNTNLSLHMNLYDKLTSNPDLFFKKFLTTLDAVVLGKTDEKIASRRRVSVNNEPKPSVSDNNEGIDVRTIDISDTILGNLRDATPIESGRTLEF